MLIGGLLDCMVVFPLTIIVLLCMLQDRRRPLWPVAVMTVPLVAAHSSYALLPAARIYILLLGIGLVVYMVRAVRQYGRWLRDNYADLEHKEVWQSVLVLAVILLVFGIYVSGSDSLTYEFIIQVCGIVLVCYLLWRVETLSDLGQSGGQTVQDLAQELVPMTAETTTPDDIGPLLQQYCVDTKLYLQHDLTVAQLAQTIGTNRTYLGQYFARQDTTYNAYINNLRINHFIFLSVRHRQ